MTNELELASRFRISVHYHHGCKHSSVQVAGVGKFSIWSPKGSQEQTVLRQIGGGSQKPPRLWQASSNKATSPSTATLWAKNIQTTIMLKPHLSPQSILTIFARLKMQIPLPVQPLYPPQLSLQLNHFLIVNHAQDRNPWNHTHWGKEEKRTWKIWMWVRGWRACSIP